MNSNNINVNDFLSNIEKYIENTHFDDSVPYLLDFDKYENFKKVYKFFKGLVSDFSGRFVCIDCQPETLRATLTLDLPMYDAYGFSLKKFLHIVDLCDVFSLSPSSSDGILIDVCINDMWKPFKDSVSTYVDVNLLLKLLETK